MNSSEILKFCLEKGMLVDKEALNLFDKEGDVSVAKVLLERLRHVTSERIITKKLIGENRQLLEQVKGGLSDTGQKRIEKLKSNLESLFKFGFRSFFKCRLSGKR